MSAQPGHGAAGTRLVSRALADLAARARHAAASAAAGALLAAAAALVAIATPGPLAHAQIRDDLERNILTGPKVGPPAERERGSDDVALPDPMPAVPPDSATLEFDSGERSTNRYAIDPASLAIDDFARVRYMLVVTSSSGARNVSYEAIRCDGGDHRVLAIARADGSWVPTRSPSWQPSRRGDPLDQARRELARSYFCKGTTTLRSPREIVARLKSPPRVAY